MNKRRRYTITPFWNILFMNTRADNPYQAMCQVIN